MKHDEELEALKLAIKTEQDGRKMYLDASGRISNPLATSTFTTLAAEELIHIQIIESFYNQIKAGEKETPSEQLQKAQSYDLRRKTIFEAARGRMEKTVLSDPDVFEAYRAAMKFEEDGAKMYEDLAKKTSHEVAKKMYDFLNIQENEHYRILAETLNYLENPNQWFIEQEKPHFEA
jgi:rubrerythrin